MHNSNEKNQTTTFFLTIFFQASEGYHFLNSVKKDSSNTVAL